MEFNATIPSNVQSIDFEKVSELVGCTHEELIDGLQANSTAVDFTGAIVGANVTKPIAFEATTTTTTTTTPETTTTNNNGDIESNDLTSSTIDETTVLLAKPPKSHRKIPSLLIGIPSTTTTTITEEDSHLFDNNNNNITTQQIQIVEDNKTVTQDNVFDGFLIGVEHLRSESSCSSNSSSTSTLAGEEVRLLNGDGETTTGGHHRRRHTRGFSIDEPLFLSIPADIPTVVDDTTTTTTHDHPDRGYLIDIPLPSSSSTDEPLHQSVLAIPTLPPPTHEPLHPTTLSDDDIPPTTILSRSLSYLPHKPLPTDVETISLAVVGRRHHSHLEAVVARRVPLLGYLLLATALLAASTTGTALRLQSHAPALMKLYWRMTVTVLCFSPMATKSIVLDGYYPKFGGGREDVVGLMACAACYVLSSGAFVMALDLTSVAAVSLYSTFHTFILVVGKVVLGMEVGLFEGVGTIVGIFGGVMSALDKPPVEEEEGSNPVLGDFFAFMSAVGAAGYLLLACKLRRKFDLFVFICMNLGVGSFMLLAVMYFMGIPLELSRDESVGLFGWLNMTPDRLPLELYIVFVCNGLGMLGYVAVMKYFESLVISVTMLVQPEIATVVSLLCGVGTIPGKWGYMGAFFVTVGAMMVIVSASRKTETYDVGEAVEKVVVPGKSAKVVPMTPKRVGYDSTFEPIMEGKRKQNYVKHGSFEMQ